MREVATRALRELFNGAEEKFIFFTGNQIFQFIGTDINIRNQYSVPISGGLWEILTEIKVRRYSYPILAFYLTDELRNITWNEFLPVLLFGNHLSDFCAACAFAQP